MKVGSRAINIIITEKAEVVIDLDGNKHLEIKIEIRGNGHLISENERKVAIRGDEDDTERFIQITVSNVLGRSMQETMSRLGVFEDFIDLALGAIDG